MQENLLLIPHLVFRWVVFLLFCFFYQVFSLFFLSFSFFFSSCLQIWKSQRPLDEFWVYKTQSDSCDGTFCENSWCLCLSSYIFNWVLGAMQISFTKYYFRKSQKINWGYVNITEFMIKKPRKETYCFPTTQATHLSGLVERVLETQSNI